MTENDESLDFNVMEQLNQFDPVKIEYTEKLLKKWSLNRQSVIQNIGEVAEKLNEWEKGTKIAETVGRAVGFIAGVFAKPVASTVLAILAADGVITSVASNLNWEKERKKIEEMLMKDEELFNELMEERQQVMEEKEMVKMFDWRKMLSPFSEERLYMLCRMLEQNRREVCKYFWNSARWSVMTEGRRINLARGSTAPERRFVIVTMNNITS